ncbi:MAG: hypothetical protein MRZ79_04465 [Bacteroidia bacterium]|nr:hypothetical protein [Bacteroidia bacterium]
MGNYTWIEHAHTHVHKDSTGKKWYKIADSKALWEEAMFILKANTLALNCLEDDSLQASIVIQTYKQSNPLFTKLSHLSQPDLHIQKWNKAINSDNWTRTARKSMHVKVHGRRTGLVLKYYPQKGKIKEIHAIGLVRKNFFAHWGEAFFETFEALVKKVARNDDPQADPIFDMHLRNAKKLIRKYEKGPK